MWVGAGWGPRQREKGCRGSPGVAGCQYHLPAGPSRCQETLRTLCLAAKRWMRKCMRSERQRHQEASILLQNRAQALHQV